MTQPPDASDVKNEPTPKRDAQSLFAANVRRTRLELGQTQEQLAEFAGLHPNYISSVERGERNISIQSMERIANSLRVTLPFLLTEREEAPSDNGNPIRKRGRATKA